MSIFFGPDWLFLTYIFPLFVPFKPSQMLHETNKTMVSKFSVFDRNIANQREKNTEVGFFSLNLKPTVN